METILCPQCKTETDASKNQCIYCGKIIIAEKLSQTPTKVNDREHSLSFDEMARKLDNLKDDDLFGDLEPMGDGTKTKTSTPEELHIDSEASEAEKRIERYEPKEETKKFVNPMAESSLMKKIKDDQDLFGSLDE